MWRGGNYGKNQGARFVQVREYDLYREIQGEANDSVENTGKEAETDSAESVLV
jgi:hypothetical protein